MSPRGAKLNQQMRAEARARITRAALEAFAQYGYHGATMNQIMQISGLSKGLVYHYFPSKEKVFVHLVDTALEISRSTWRQALDWPGTAWEKIERLSEALVKVAFTEESSLYFLVMVQAITQGRSIPGLPEHIFQGMAHYDELPRLILEAQGAGEAAPGDPAVLASTYLALFQGYTLILPGNDELKEKITPAIFTNVLRKRGKTG